MPVLTVAASVVALVWLAFAYRFLVNPLVRRRAIVLRGVVLAALLVLGVAVIALLWPGSASVSVLIAIIALGSATVATHTWLVAGITRDRVLERLRFVLRGMGLKKSTGSRDGVVADDRGMVSVRVGGRSGDGIRLLRVRTARGIKKADLFRRNVWKSLAASARGE